MNLKKIVAVGLTGIVTGVAMNLAMAEREFKPEHYVPDIQKAFAQTAGNSPGGINIFSSKPDLESYIAAEAEKAGFVVCDQSQWAEISPQDPVTKSGFYNFVVRMDAVEKSRKDREVGFVLLDNMKQIGLSSGHGTIYCLKP